MFCLRLQAVLMSPTPQERDPEDPFRTLFQLAPGAIFRCDSEGHLVNRNKAAEESASVCEGRVDWQVPETPHRQPCANKIFPIQDFHGSPMLEWMQMTWTPSWGKWRRWSGADARAGFVTTIAGLLLAAEGIHQGNTLVL